MSNGTFVINPSGSSWIGTTGPPIFEKEETVSNSVDPDAYLPLPEPTVANAQREPHPDAVLMPAAVQNFGEDFPRTKDALRRATEEEEAVAKENEKRLAAAMKETDRQPLYGATMCTPT